MATGRVNLLVLQPTPFCNLDCTYCYLPHRHLNRAMSDDTLDAIARCSSAGVGDGRAGR